MLYLSALPSILSDRVFPANDKTSGHYKDFAVRENTSVAELLLPPAGNNVLSREIIILVAGEINEIVEGLENRRKETFTSRYRGHFFFFSQVRQIYYRFPVENLFGVRNKNFSHRRRDASP